VSEQYIDSIMHGATIKKNRVGVLKKGRLRKYSDIFVMTYQ